MNVRTRIVYESNGNRRFYVDGKEVTQAEHDRLTVSKIEDLLAEPIELLPGQTPKCWPMKSDALAVHPKQIPEAMARNKRRGLHVDYDPRDGRAILNDRGQRRDLMRIENCHDNNGGYGD